MFIKPDFNRLFDFAENQGGYFTARQAHYAGFSKERLHYYITTGRFSSIHRGIYRLVQFPSSPYEDLFVAWLKVGPDAAISHESALYLYKLSDVLPDEVHVIMPRTGSRRRKGIRLHTNRLKPEEVTKREGLPVTTAARTIIDVTANGISEEHVRSAIRDAIRQGLTSREELIVMASRRGSKVQRLIETILRSEKE